MFKTLALAATIAAAPMFLSTADAGCGNGYYSGYRGVPSYGYSSFRPTYRSHGVYRPSYGYAAPYRYGVAAPRVGISIGTGYGAGYRGFNSGFGYGGLGYGNFGPGYGFGAGRGFGYRGFGVGF